LDGPVMGPMSSLREKYHYIYALSGAG
jgi:hypothetical protein